MVGTSRWWVWGSVVSAAAVCTSGAWGAGSAEAGKAKAAACMACHGPDGSGNPGAVYPQIGGQYADYTAVKLKAFRDGQGFSDDEHGKIMTSVAKPLTDADIAALSSYIEGLHAAAPKTAEIAK